MRSLYNTLAASALALSMVTPTHAASVVTTLTDFDAALVGKTITLDTFDNNIAGALSITLDSGVIATKEGGDTGFSFDNSVLSGRYDNATDGDGSDAPLTNTFTFDDPIFGFAAFFLRVRSITASIDGGTTFFDINQQLGGNGSNNVAGFFGLVSPTAFNTVIFGNSTTSDLDGYSLDDLRFATGSGPVSAVPLPATLPLLLAVVAGFGALSRLKKRTV